MSEGTAREIVMKAALRDQLGQAVRAEWVRYCLETGDTKPSHIAPWDELSDWDKEADRRIADAVLTEAGALAPAGLTADQVEALVFAVQRAAYYTERSAHSSEDHRRIAVCRGAVATLRALVAPAADAAPGEPS